MNIPDKVKIGGFEWTINYNADLMHEREERACTRPKKLMIEIDPGCQPVSMEESFIHELLEAICWQYNIQFESHKDLWILSTVLHQVIKDNSDIFTAERR